MDVRPVALQRPTPDSRMRMEGMAAPGRAGMPSYNAVRPARTQAALPGR